MKIAVSSQDFRKVSGHAGQARRWLIMAAEEGREPAVAEQLELPPALAFHHFKGSGVHPLDAAFAGDGFVTKMRKRGIEVRQTRETDARKAVADYLAGRLAPPPSRRLMSLFCKVRDAFSSHA